MEMDWTDVCKMSQYIFKSVLYRSVCLSEDLPSKTLWTYLTPAQSSCPS